MKNTKKSVYETHKELIDKEWHYDKNNELGIYPTDITQGSGKKVWWECSEGHKYDSVCYNRIRGNGYCPFCSGRRPHKDNCLQTMNPELASQWHPTRNILLTPNDITSNSNKKVWWECEKGHEWKSTCNNRMNGNGCPYCSNHKVCNENCLETINPELSKQWHPTKNGELSPKDVIAGSNKKAWWICENGHEWKASIYSRSSIQKHNCPYCSNQKVCKDNCLSTTNPELARQWHPIRNGNLTPKDVIAGSKKKVWWICNKNHEWKAAISDRGSGQNCPYCSNRSVCEDNCLATVNPELVRQWHPTKNGSLTPHDVTSGSGKKAWWICNENHEWFADVNSRNKGSGCPECAIINKNGSNNPNYNPNLTDEERLIGRNLPGYSGWRNSVYTRDDYTCQVCYVKGNSINAHHLQGYNKHIDLRTDKNNGVTMCSEHHNDFHNIYGRGNNTKEQYEEYKNNIILKKGII